LFSVASLAVRKRTALLNPRAQAAPDLDPLDVGEHPVEDDQVRLLAGGGLQGLPAAEGLFDLVALVAEGGRDSVDDRGLVVDDEDAAGDAVGLHGTIVARVTVNRL